MEKKNFQKEIFDITLRILFSKWHSFSVEKRRKRNRLFDVLSPIDQKSRIIEFDQSGVLTKRIIPKRAMPGKIIYLHGGAYVLGMSNNHINLCGKIAEKSRLTVYMPHYRLAPEYPYPCALDDAFDVYCEITKPMDEGKPVFIGGDSAGGGLALGLLQKIREQGKMMPHGVFLFSPWTDLTLSGNSIIENAGFDPVLTASGLKADASAYAGDRPLDDPHISPLFCDMSNFPPILFQVGSREILLDDTNAFALKAKKQGVDVKLSIWKDMPHVFQVFPMLKEAEQAIDEVVGFIEYFS